MTEFRKLVENKLSMFKEWSEPSHSGEWGTIETCIYPRVDDPANKPLIDLLFEIGYMEDYGYNKDDDLLDVVNKEWDEYYARHYNNQVPYGSKDHHGTLSVDDVTIEYSIEGDDYEDEVILEAVYLNYNDQQYEITDMISDNLKDELQKDLDENDEIERKRFDDEEDVRFTYYNGIAPGGKL